MGFNTAVVLLNDQSKKWPEELNLAAREKHARNGAGWFGWGQVIGSGHADHVQVLAVGGNTGVPVEPDRYVPEHVLNALEMVLRGHGYTVRKPGRTRGQGPLPWGYHAKEQNKTKT